MFLIPKIHCTYVLWQSEINNMKCRIVYKPDKTVAIIYPTPKSKKEIETEKQWLERVFNKAMQVELKDLPYDDIDDSQLPSRENRDAWEGEKGVGISINQAKAKEIRDAKKLETKIQEKLRELALREIEKEE